jgi:hypothetical protein
MPEQDDWRLKFQKLIRAYDSPTSTTAHKAIEESLKLTKLLEIRFEDAIRDAYDLKLDPQQKLDFEQPQYDSMGEFFRRVWQAYQFRVLLMGLIIASIMSIYALWPDWPFRGHAALLGLVALLWIALHWAIAVAGVTSYGMLFVEVVALLALGGLIFLAWLLSAAWGFVALVLSVALLSSNLGSRIKASQFWLFRAVRSLYERR